MASTPVVFPDPEQGDGAPATAPKPRSNRWTSCSPNSLMVLMLIKKGIGFGNVFNSSRSWIAQMSSNVWAGVCKAGKGLSIIKIQGVSKQFLKFIASRVSRWALVRWMQAAYGRAEARYPGWELGVISAIAVTSFTLTLHIIFLITVSIKFKHRSNGLGTLWEGECDAVGWVNKIVHAIISMSSTILIAQSNYCLQVLASPTRNEVDTAHKNKEWVDIGMPSFRNVWSGHIGRRRIVCWAFIVFASCPLYLLWNSFVIFSPVAYQYNQLTVSNGFVDGLPFEDNNNNTGMALIDYSSEGDGACWPDNLHFLQGDLHNYERLENHDCMKKYAQFFLADRSDVIVVTKPSTPDSNVSAVLGGAAAGWGPWPYQWMCPPESRQKLACLKILQGHNDQWEFPHFGGPAVEYCLSKKMQKKCRLEYGLAVTCLTVGAIALKLALFSYAYFLVKRGSKGPDGCDTSTQRKLQPLITTGDAIASFLEFEDKTTRGMSTVEKKHFEDGIWNHHWVDINPMRWRERRPCCRFRAIGVRRWVTGMVMYASPSHISDKNMLTFDFILILIPLVPFAFLFSKYRWLKNDLGVESSTIGKLGLGNPSGLFLFGDNVPSSSGTFRNIVTSNTPQLALAFAYYIWNTQAIVMITAREYNLFATSTNDPDPTVFQQPKHPLRMTYASKGTEQRNSHFFSIPVRYWIPMAALWTLLQWLASQTLFFARVDSLNHWLKPAEFSISQVGYSLLGMICFVAVSLVVFIWGAVLSCKNIENRMPLAATCSAALSAACHPRDPNLKHFEKKIHWGVERPANGNPPTGSERCTFTSLEARYPTYDQRYA